MTEEKEKDHKELLVLLDGLQPTHQPLSTVTHPFLNVLIQMKNQARSNDTIKNTSKALQVLSKHAEI
jgi:hypothetical protein